jgi:diacylglycerol kinase family enzyme
VRGPIKRRSFVEAVGFGALAKALDKGEQAEKRTGNGVDAGLEALRKAFIDDDPEHLSVTLDNHKLRGDFFLVEVLNIPFAGPGLPLAPWAHSGDGLLDVAAVEKSRRKEMLAWLDHPERSIPPVTLRQARKVSLTWRGGPFRVDDDFYHDTVREGTVTIKLKKYGVRVLIPQANGRGK